MSRRTLIVVGIAVAAWLAVARSAVAQTPTPARTPVAVQQLTFTVPAEVTMSTVGTHWRFVNDGRSMLVVRNGGASPVTVTVYGTPEPRFGRVANAVLTIAAGNVGIFPPLPPEAFNQRTGPDTGRVYVEFSATTDVTAGVLRLP